MGITVIEEKEKGTKSILKVIMPENFLNLEKEINIQIHEKNINKES